MEGAESFPRVLWFINEPFDIPPIQMIVGPLVDDGVPSARQRVGEVPAGVGRFSTIASETSSSCSSVLGRRFRQISRAPPKQTVAGAFESDLQRSKHWQTMLTVREGLGRP